MAILVDEAAGMEAEYRRQGDVWASRRNDEPQFGVCGHWLNGNWTTCNTMERYRDVWYEGANWIRDADEGYKELAEFYETTIITTTTGGCECFTPGGVAKMPADSDDECDAQCPFYHEYTPIVTKTIHERVLLDNDGVVTAKSATAFGTDYHDMPRSNHFQMRNDPNTEAALDLLLDGGGNAWFVSLIP